MRDGMAGGSGYGAASDPVSGQGEPGWDQGRYRDDAHVHSPGTTGPTAARRHGGHGSGSSSGSGHGGGHGSSRGSGHGHAGGDAATAGIPTQRRPDRSAHRAGGDGGDGPGDPQTGPAGGGHRRGGSRGRKKPVSRKRKAVKWLAIGTSVAVLGTAGAAYGYYEYLSSKIHKGQRVSGDTHAVKTKANAQGDTPLNILILGSDSRADPEDRKLGGASDSQGERADVIMIAHLSADRSNMSIVSIPRDTRVDIPRCEDPKTGKVYPATNDIINSSLNRGGAGCTLATVQNLTGGLYIDHWLTIDFDGVVKMADVLGGAQVCVQQNVDDHPTASQPGGSHLHMLAGTHTVRDQQALQWLRTRHAFGSDAMRSKAQHMYMSSLLRNLREENLFSNPARLNDIATKAMSAFTVSSEIGTPKKLYDLGMQLKSIPPKRITMLTMPHIEDPEDKHAHYLPTPGASQRVWALLRNDVPMDANGNAKPTTAPGTKPTATAPAGPAAQASATIPVTVVNGTAGTKEDQAVPGRATAVKKVLVTAGFTQATADQQSAPSPITTLVYPSDSGAQGKSNALAVAKAAGIPATHVKASTTAQSITLTVGADWTTGSDYAKTLPKAGSVPDGSDAMNGSESSEKNCMYIEPVYRF